MIQVVGKLGSGKTFIAKRIAEDLGWDFIEVSDIVSKILKKSKEDGREDLQEGLKGKTGSQLLLDEIKNHLIKREIVLCGSREPWHVYNLFKLDGIYDPIVYVEADDYTRYIRICKRDGYITPAQFDQMNLRDKELGMDILMSGSTFSINIIDNGLNADFKHNCNCVMENIREALKEGDKE